MVSQSQPLGRGESAATSGAEPSAEERGRAERWAEAAFNEGWRSREARLGPILNSRSEMRKCWIESNARDAIIEGVLDDH